ncbi:hypothetical protein [Steroidobacter sp.]|uniref:hypothetical protein n=1 Tax=Steroidobacter sp. TaxID=1978227 RepID=UPI001A45FC8A|nr:hypothetical protein [Steroidobacter sp.]MBL8272034.1 hypothetical protein [Steroidobacter sp.]
MRAIEVFLGNLQHARVARKRSRRLLFERASQEPQKVLSYLNSQPEGGEGPVHLKEKLRQIAADALAAQAC